MLFSAPGYQKSRSTSRNKKINKLVKILQKFENGKGIIEKPLPLLPFIKACPKAG